MHDIWIGISAAICGTIVGWALTESSRAVTGRRKAVRDLNASAFVCLDRLLKVRDANGRGDIDQRDKEIYHLGGDMDRYRDRIAGSPLIRKRHWTVYKRMRPILLEHDMADIDTVIGDLERVGGVEA